MTESGKKMLRISCGWAITCLAIGCSPTSVPKPEPVALHRAAIKLRVLLQDGFQRDTLAHATSDLHVEYEVAKANLSNEAAKKCERAASVSDSLRQIFRAVSDYDPDELAGLRSEFENVGLVKNDGDWQNIQLHISNSLPRDSDTDEMTDEKAQLRSIETGELFSPARNAALKMARECEQAT